MFKIQTRLHYLFSPQYFSPDPAVIFSGIVACAGDLPSADLAAGITALGGQWRMGLTKDVTHLFAISPQVCTGMHFRDDTGGEGYPPTLV